MLNWDELVTTIAGGEGSLRYQRIGLLLLVGGVVCVMLLMATPLYTIGDVSGTYFSIADSPDESPTYMYNGIIHKYATNAIIAYALVAIVGLLFILEGRGVVNLRRYMVWHSEVRATALYALAVVVAFVGLLYSGALFSMSIGEPEVHAMEGVTVQIEISSTAGTSTMAVGLLMVLGLLFMLYYNTVLSVYRGGIRRELRRLARWAFLVAFIPMVGLFLLYSTNVMVQVFDVTDPLTGVLMSETIYPYTRMDIAGLVDSGDATTSIERLGTDLWVLSLSLLSGVLLGLGGCVGVAAAALGQPSRRVMRALSYSGLAAFSALVILIMTNITWGDVRDVSGVGPFFSVSMLVGTPIVAGLVVGIALLAFSLLAVRELGEDFIIRRLLAGRQAAEVGAGVEPAEVAAAPPAEAAPAAAEPPERPLDVEEVVEGPRRPPLGRRLLGPRVGPLPLLVVVVAVIVVIAGISIALTTGDGGGGGDDDDGPPMVVIEDLEPFVEYETVDLFLSEGDTFSGDALAELFEGQREDTVYFFNTIELSIGWEDEPDQGIVIDRLVNQPDSFELAVYDDQGIDSATGSGTNPQGGSTSVDLVWSAGGEWAAFGNQSLVRLADEWVGWNPLVTYEVTLLSSGDYENLIGMTRQTDGGNSATLDLHVEGYAITLSGG